MKFWNRVFGIKMISKTRSPEPVAAGSTIASSVVRELRFAATWGASCNAVVSAGCTVALRRRSYGLRVLRVI